MRETRSRAFVQVVAVEACDLNRPRWWLGTTWRTCVDFAIEASKGEGPGGY